MFVEFGGWIEYVFWGQEVRVSEFEFRDSGFLGIKGDVGHQNILDLNSTEIEGLELRS